MKSFEYMEVLARKTSGIKTEERYGVTFVECDHVHLSTSIAQWGLEGWQLVQKDFSADTFVLTFIRELYPQQPEAPALEV